MCRARILLMILTLVCASSISRAQSAPTHETRIEKLEAALAAVQTELAALKAEQAKAAKAAVDQKQIDAMVSKAFDQKKDDLKLVPDWINNVARNAQSYGEAFAKYVALAAQKDSAAEEMITGARDLQTVADTIRAEQKAQLALVMNAQAHIAEGSRAHLAWAGLVKEFLADKSTTLNVETNGHNCAFGKWLDSQTYVTEAAACSQQFRQLIDEIKQKHLDLHASAVKVAKARTADSDTSLEVYKQKTAPLLQENLTAFAKLEDIIKAGVDDKITKADDGNRFIKWALACRRDEKNYIMKGDSEYVGKVDNTIDQIITLATNLETRFNQEKNKKQAQQILTSAAKYKNNFGNFVKLTGDQITADRDMVTAARQVQQLCDESRQIQKTKMDATSARSNVVMIAGAAVAIALGSILAFFITRGITKPISRIIAGLTEGSEQVASASGQVSSASQSLAEGATEQAAGMEETSSSLEEMSFMTKQNADNAQQANTLANEARKAADTGAESMTKMNEAIQDIQKSSDETAKIIKVIDEIAFQTNLLALNAAVEAAKNTANMIEESVKNAKNGVDIAGEVAKVLDEIVQGVGKTTDLVSEIAAASQEQAQGIDQVNTAVAQMDKVTQQNAANAEESASASEELSVQAEQMNSIVSELVAMVGGSSSGRSSSNRKRAGSRSKSTEQNLHRSDHAFHQIANGTTKKPEAKAKAEKAIPLVDATSEGKDDFKEFNG